MEALLPLIITFGLMWALLIRPQQRRVRQHQELVSTLSAGDEVITTGGIVGTIASVDDEILTLEVAPDTFIRVLRSAVQTRIAPFEASDLVDGDPDDLDALEDAFAEDAYADDRPGEPVPGPRDITGVMPVAPPPVAPPPADPPRPPPPPPPVSPADTPPPPPTGEKA